ncbi:MAG: hypothetical protein HY925_09350, partial [Elusimicrobia bacterium]|nr:hypothetical protein [Elusimicrobiota bacterium]
MRARLAAFALLLAPSVWANTKGAAPVEIAPVNAGVGAAPLAGAAALPQTAPTLQPTLSLPAPLATVQPVGFARRMASAAAERLRAFAGVGEKVPSWPGKEGETVRLGKAKWTLDRIAGEGGGSTVWDADRAQVVKILHPETADLPHYGGEAALLKAIKDSEIPHAKLIAASADGRVMVKEK